MKIKSHPALTIALFLSSVAAHSAELIDHNEKFQPNGVVSKAESYTKGEVIYQETGELNGVNYRFFFSDGSGSFAGESGNKLAITEKLDSNWSLSCDVDAMSDKKSCLATKGDLHIFFPANGKPLVSVGASVYPGIPVKIRIGKNTPLTNEGDKFFDAASSAAVLNSLLKGEAVRTRYSKWPYETPIDGEVSPYGVAEVKSYVDWALSKM